MNNQGILLLQLLVVSWNCGLGHAVPCWPGLRLHKSADPHTRDICLFCKDGTFMAEKEHMNEKCNICSETISPLEIVITACNITHDTEIQCVPGYYRRAHTALENDTCEECRTCESGFPARPCLGYNDTVCCPLEHDAVWTCEGKYECQERPACGAGMYYNTSLDRCLSCPNGTYMQAHYHTTRECLKCEMLSGNSSNHVVILQPCTRTSPTVFGCEDFHFRASDSGSLLEEAPCRPCQKCPLYLRQCQILHDAVCAEDSQDDANTSEDTGLTEDTETRARGTSVPNDTLQGHERNESNRSRNGTTECQTCVPSNVYANVVVFVTIIAILMSAFVHTVKPDIGHSHSRVACSRFKTPRNATGLFVLLLLLLISSVLLTTGAIEASHHVITAFVVIAVPAAGSFVITAIFLTRGPQKPQVNEEGLPGTAVDGDYNRRQSHELLQQQKGKVVTSMD